MAHHCRRFVGKVAVLTSATEGITFAAAERLAEEGAKVLISSRKESKVKAATEKLRRQGYEAHGVVCHVGKPDQVQNLFKEAERLFGGFDVLVASTGVSTMYGPTVEMFEINTKAVFMLVKASLPFFKKKGGGSIVLLGTNGSYNNALNVADYETKSIGIYGASKTAMIALMKAMTHQLSENNVRINCVAPGPVRTKFMQGLKARKEAQLGIRGNTCIDLSAIQPINRMGEPSEVASCMAFFASEDASFVTGEVLVVAGGGSCRL